MRDVEFKLDVLSKELSIVKPPKRLVITSGDTSDVDGFLALAEYSKVPDRLRMQSRLHLCKNQIVSKDRDACYSDFFCADWG